MEEKPANGLQTKLFDEHYTWRTASAAQLGSFYFNLRPVPTTTFKAHFRISLEGQIIDFYTYDNVIYHGKLTNYTIEYKYTTVENNGQTSKQSKQYQYVFEQVDLAPSKVRKAVKKLLKTGQSKIPTDALIASWKTRFYDCGAISFQFNINGQYTRQTFRCPWGQKDEVAFKNTILGNYKMLRATLELDSLYSTFENKLPGGTYSSNGYLMMHK